MHTPAPGVQTSVTPLILADRLISLAQDADRAGYAQSATRLLGLAYAVFDEEPSAPSLKATGVAARQSSRRRSGRL